MAHSKFSLDGLEDSTRQVILPDHVMPLGEEEEVCILQLMEAGNDTQLSQTPPGSPAPVAPEEFQGEQAGDFPDNSVLKCIMEDACDHLHAFQEYEHYSLVVNSESDCDVPEDELTDEMEDTPSAEDQLTPVCLEGPAEGDHGQQSPGDIRAVGETIAIE